MPFWIFCYEKPVLAANKWCKWTFKGSLMSSRNVINEYEIMFWFLTLDLEWKIIYVGSAESEEYDQVLDSVLVGPVPAGRHMFVFQVRLFLVNMYAKYISKWSLTLSFWVKSLWFCCIHFLSASIMF